MNTFNPTCLLLCLANLTFAYDVPPSIVEQPESINGDQRIPLTLICRATGIPEPSYYWVKDGALFNVDSNDRASLDGGNLVIQSLTTADNGQYQCFANNRLGTAMSKKIWPSLAFMDQFENTEPARIQVRRGRPLKLLCGGSPGVPDGNPAPLIYWTDATAKPTPITYNARITQDPEGNLVFSNAIASDAQGYYCQAINNVVGSSQRAAKITLSVIDLPAVERRARLVTKPAASEIAMRTQFFMLNCIAYGYPTPVITWKRGEEQLQSGGRVSIEFSGHDLVISAVENSDEGTYTCVASNTRGDDVFSTVVTVESAPYFPAPPSDETKAPGESVDIECRSEGVPAPTVDWFVNGQSWADFESNIDTERWTVVTGDPQLATISITNLQTTDSNVFQCIATNKYQEELTSVVLNVVSIPARIPSFTPLTRRLSVVEDDSAAFTCHVEGRPTPTITWTFKGSVLSNGDKYTIDEMVGSVVINNALEVDSGAYECSAENSIDGEDHMAMGSATLTVLGKTIITLPPADLTVREDSTATFQCEITYDHELNKPTVYWMKDSQRLEANQDNSLRIDNAMFSNSGTYTCFVETTLDESAGTVHSVNASAQLVVKAIPASIPSFTPLTRKLSVVQNDSAKFTCHVEGIPTPTITWTFKGSVLTNRDKYTVNEIEGSLVINNVKKVDSGEYECRAENAIDREDHEATGSATLIVLGTDFPPSIVEQPESVTGDQRIPLTLTCRAIGTPAPAYYWEKDGALFDMDSNDRASLDGGNLVIESLTTADDGQYQCFAKNRLGTAMSQKIWTSLAFMEQFVNTAPAMVQMSQGQPLKLRCGGSLGVPNGNPAPLIYWTDAAPKPTAIGYDARINQDLEGNLVFSNIIASDAKGYYCLSINNVIGSFQRSPKVTLSVTDLPAVASAAHLDTHPAASEVAKRTQSFKLKCIAFGYPTPVITWKRGEEQLQSGGRLSIEESAQALVISAVEISDEGTYTCVASNTGGDDEFSTVVTVESAPYFPAPPSDEIKGPGESVNIECRSEGVPAPTVDWLVNGQPWADFESNIDTERWTVVTGDPQLATIAITNLQTTDSSVFQCIATNKYKEELTSVVLNVVYFPARITSYTPLTRRLSVVEDDSAKFICHSKGRPDPTITWTFKGSLLTNGIKYTISETEGSLVINNVKKVDSGEYECTAENSIDGEDYEATGSATLTVLGKTTIYLSPANLMIRGGNTATFQCEITYDEELIEPYVFWMKDGQRLEANQDNSLRIENAYLTHSGTYTCFVETTLDESAGTVHSVNASAQLIVKGRPESPQILMLRAKQQEFAMELFWEPGNDNNNNAPIQYYIIQYDTKWADMHWQFQANETSSGLAIYRKVLYLQPFVDYRFRVIAVNEIGESEPSAGIAPTVDPQVAPPSENPSVPVVSGSSTRPESMVIRWQAIHPFYYGGDGFHYEVAYRPRISSAPFTKATVDPENTDDNPTGIIQNYIVNASQICEEFEFSVQSMNSEGPGPEPEIHHGVSGEACRPESPQILMLRAKQQEFAMDLFWEPGNDNNAPIQYYIIQYDTKWADMHWQFQANETASGLATYRKVLYLQPFVDYRFRVIAVNEIGESEPSAEVASRVDPQVAPPSINPSGVNGSTTRTSTVIRWQAIHPFYYGGDDFHYEVAYRPRLSSEPFTKDSVYPENTDDNPTGIIQNYIVDASQLCEEFEFSVRSMNSEGPGPEPEIHYGFPGVACLADQ